MILYVFSVACFFFTHLFHCFIVFFVWTYNGLSSFLLMDVWVFLVWVYLWTMPLWSLLCASCSHCRGCFSQAMIYKLEHVRRGETWGFKRHMGIDCVQGISLQVSNFCSYIFLKAILSNLSHLIALFPLKKKESIPLTHPDSYASALN